MADDTVAIEVLSRRPAPKYGLTRSPFDSAEAVCVAVNVYSINGRLYYETPTVELSTVDPYVTEQTDERKPE